MFGERGGHRSTLFEQKKKKEQNAHIGAVLL